MSTSYIPKTPLEKLEDVNTAIDAILSGGQSYKIGSRQLTRANLAELFAMRKEYEAELASAESSNLVDDTYLGYFEGR